MCENWAEKTRRNNSQKIPKFGEKHGHSGLRSSANPKKDKYWGVGVGDLGHHSKTSEIKKSKTFESRQGKGNITCGDKKFH